MAILNTNFAITYAGNGSKDDPYPITFPFLEEDHIHLALAADEDAEPVQQAPSAFTVTRAADGQGGQLRTKAAIAPSARLTIFRHLPLTQPTRFPQAGPFPAKAHEQALDRLTMQIQQIDARVEEGSGSGAIPVGGALDVLSWLDAAARAGVTPTRVGQLGVERATQTIWISQATTAGAWEEYGRRRADRLVLGLVADGGATQREAIAEALAEWEVDAVLFSGDNDPDGDGDWGPFESYIDNAAAFPALGNRDVDDELWQTAHALKFDAYLRDNPRYYHRILGEGLVDLFVLHSGRDSIWEPVEPDGNAVGSSQHDWFVQALARSRARWKIALFHHPPATISDNTDQIIEPAMDWPELAQMDLICCGHAQLLEMLRWRDTLLVSVSAPTPVGGSAAVTLQGGGPVDHALWADDLHTGVGRIVASAEKLTVEVWAVGGTYYGRRLLHVREARDFSTAPPLTETYTLCRGSYPAATYYVCTLPAAAWLEEITVCTHEADDALSWTLRGGAEELGAGSAEPGELRSTSTGTNRVMIPAGTVLTLEVQMQAPRSGLAVSLTTRRHA